MLTNNQKKEWIRNGIYIFFILLLAVISTHYIYYHFQEDRNIDFNSESLDVTYRESTGNKISLTKIIPVTDSVGLSSKAYVITIKNNLTEKVNYRIELVDDPEYKEDIVVEKEEENVEKSHWIPKEEMKISVKNGKLGNKIYSFDEIDDGILLKDTMNALEEKNITIRLWIKQDSNLNSKEELFYHGIMNVIEEEK